MGDLAAYQWRLLSVAIKGSKGESEKYEGVDFVRTQLATPKKSWNGSLVEVSEATSVVGLCDEEKDKFQGSIVFSNDRVADVQMFCQILELLEVAAVIIALRTNDDLYLSKDDELPLPVLYVHCLRVFQF